MHNKLHLSYCRFIRASSFRRLRQVSVPTCEIWNAATTPYRTLATFFQPISAQGIGLAPAVFYQLNYNRPIPYVQQWNFTLQKGWKSFVFESSYVGSEGVKLPFLVPVNVPLP